MRALVLAASPGAPILPSEDLDKTGSWICCEVVDRRTGPQVHWVDRPLKADMQCQPHRSQHSSLQEVQ